MKTKYETKEMLEGKTLWDLPAVWEQKSTTTGDKSLAYNRQHASRARRWLALSFAPAERRITGETVDGDAICLMREVALIRLLDLDPCAGASGARAAFLCFAHGVAPALATGNNRELNLPDNVRKAANNVRESAFKAIRFLQTCFGANYGIESGGEWPAALRDRRYLHGMILYRAIQRAHMRAGLRHPDQGRSDLVLQAAKPLIEQCTKLRNAGPYNTRISQLGNALRLGLLAPLKIDLLAGLPVLSFTENRNANAAFSCRELNNLWPKEFPHLESETGRLDRTKGLLGFYNKELGGRRPANAQGELCPRQNLLSPNTLSNRLEALQRFLFRAANKSDHGPAIPLSDHFRAEALIKWFESYVDERGGMVTRGHKTDFFHIRYTAALYFGHDMSALDEWVEDEIDFPEAEESMRGSRVLTLAKTPLALLEQARMFAAYAALTEPLSGRRASGFYLPRKSCQLDVLIRTETGLRPENIDELDVFFDQPDASQCGIWKLPDGRYRISIPYRRMKQHKRRRGASKKQSSGRRPYVFDLVRPETIAALDDYLDHGWRHARSVKEGRTRRLLLNRAGEPFRRGTLRCTFIDVRGKARLAWERSRPTPPPPALDRYSHRHLVGEFLRRHIPAGMLKTWYLTHRSDKKSDRCYGDDDAALLRECIGEILDGKPSRPEQERQREQERHQREMESQRLLENLTIQLGENNSKLSELADQLKAKDDEVRSLRGKLAEMISMKPAARF